MSYSHFIYVFFLSSCILATNATHAQSGCTDPAATNYSASATINDGSCTYPVTHATPVLKAALASNLPESSGLIWCDGKLWSHNDSGNPSDFYRVDTTTGAVIQKVSIDNYPNTDWEDIAADSGYIYLGDCGNNDGTRRDLKILKVSKADIGTGSTVHVNAQAISFSYSDQTSFSSSSTNNYDCEGFFSRKDSLYLFTKDRGDLKTRVYKLPKVPGTYSVAPYTNFNTNGLITGADYNATTHEIVLLGYMDSHANSFLYMLNDYQGDQFFSGNKRRIEIGHGTDWATEGVTWMSPTRLFISCETSGGTNASLYSLYKTWMPLPASVANLLQPSAIFCYPNPVQSYISVTISDNATEFQIVDMNGHIVANGALVPGNNTINIDHLAAGTYQIMTNRNLAQRIIKY